MQMATLTLAALESIIRESWGPDTVDPDDGWSEENPARGQCDVTALVVHDFLGGDLLGAEVYLAGGRIEGHMWNRLPSGIDVDLTREQFRHGEVIGEPLVRPRPEKWDPQHPRHHRYEAYLILAERVRARIEDVAARQGLQPSTGGSEHP
jgi:hypothetical protein